MNQVDKINSQQTSAPAHHGWGKGIELNFDQNTPPPQTRGEKVFNALSWALFGWLANALVSIKLADTMENLFRPIYKTFGQKMADSKPFKAFFKDKPEEASTLARSLFSVIALLPGGYTVLVPIKIMEDAKVSLVKKFDAWFGPSNPDDNTKQLTQARHSYLESAPKLNWGDMIKGRTLPVIGIVATHFAFASDKTNIINLTTQKQTFEGLNKKIERMGNRLYDATKNSRFESVKKTTTSIENYLDKGAKRNIEMYGEKHYIDNGKLRNGVDRYKGYLSNLSVDLVYSALVAAATFVIGHISAFNREEKKVIKEYKKEGITNVEKHKFHLDIPAVEQNNTPSSTVIENAVYEDKLHAPQKALS